MVAISKDFGWILTYQWKFKEGRGRIQYLEAKIKYKGIQPYRVSKYMQHINKYNKINIHSIKHKHFEKEHVEAIHCILPWQKCLHEKTKRDVNSTTGRNN